MEFQLFIFLFTFYLITVVENSIIGKRKSQLVNNEPIIGLLTQEMDPGVEKAYPDQYKSYLIASFVKFVEGAGARALPIWLGKDDAYYEDVMSKINGVLLPAGYADFNDTNGYADTGEKIYNIAKKFNDNGDYFPIFGICLGFELIPYLAANRVEHRDTCSTFTLALPLIFTPDYKESRLFKDAPETVIEILRSENVTVNYHTFCVTKTGFNKVNLTNELRFMSLNHDENGLEFISSLEHKKYPFYGLQFHPEKINYEWAQGRNIPHGENATIVQQYFANFFIKEARKSLHKFEDKEEESKALIYNYSPIYTGLKHFYLVQYYLFS